MWNDENQDAIFLHGDSYSYGGKDSSAGFLGEVAIRRDDQLLLCDEKGLHFLVY